MQTTIPPRHEGVVRHRRRAVTGPVRAMGRRDERTVVARVLDGDEAAFATLLRRHHRQMVRLAGCYVDGGESAERIARDAWARALDRLETFDGTESLKVWLGKILAGHVAPHVAPGEQTAPNTNTSPGTRIASEALELGARRIGQRAIEALPPLQRRVLVLRDVDGWSCREVCELLGIGMAEERRLLHSARTEVCAAMETYRAIARLEEAGR